MTGLGLLTTEDEDCSWSSEVAVTEAAATEAVATAEALSAPILASLEERLPPPAPPTESRDGGRASRKMESRRPREVVVESGSKGKSCFILSFKWKIRQ